MIENWKPRQRPGGVDLKGRYACLRYIDPAGDSASLFSKNLFSAICGPENEHLWQYVPPSPPDDAPALQRFLDREKSEQGWVTYGITEQGCVRENLLGMASFMRVRPDHGSVEVGCIIFSKALQRTRTATEAIYLMARHVFDTLGYRRFEWKCNNQNEASKRAALRYGFKFEGIFRNDMVVKGESRDTAWYSIIDSEWPALDQVYARWLSPDNFDAQQHQRQTLSSLMARA